MLKLIDIDNIPKPVQDIINTIDNFLYIYACKGMFGYQHIDYLIVITEEEKEDDIRCYGYVYNGAEPSFSEFGYFGLNKDKTERIW